jgi:solute:Na+ symporter, SSS family
MSSKFLDSLTKADFIIFFLMLAITLGAVIVGHLRSSKNSGSPIDVILDGRRLTLPLFIATLVSTWYGGIFGVTQIAYEYGIYNFITQGVFWYGTYILFAFFVAPKVRHSDVHTLPELSGKLFGEKSRFITSIFNILNVLPVAYALSIGIFIDILFGTGVAAGTLYGTFFVIIYSMFGGFRAIIFSDLVQFFIMIASVILVLFYSVHTFGGLDFLTENLPATHFDVTGGQSFLTMMVWGIIALSTLVDPNFYQRVFAAKDLKTARRGILLSTIVWCLFDICTTAGAMYAAAHLTNVDSSQAYLIHSMEVLPSGLRGFFLAGILATIFSTLDSYIFIASTTIVYDIFKKRGQMLLAHHASTIVVGVTAALLSMVFSGGIKSVWKTLGSYSAGCLLFPMLWALLGKRKVSDTTFAVAAVLAAVTISAWRWIPREGFLAQIDDLYIGVLTTIIVVIIGDFANRKIKPKAEHQA